ncbi:MAG: YhcH/YjgK/YiaL family protein, partial [Mariprofundales bacterium]|nr:YhcH/YjgK/YiaL family protein [Mariprofundales bacterium]
MRSDIKAIPAGKHVIDGDRIFAIVEQGLGREKADALLETHENYIDIQLVLSGVDTMGWKPKAWCTQP